MSNKFNFYHQKEIPWEHPRTKEGYFVDDRINYNKDKCR